MAINVIVSGGGTIVADVNGAESGNIEVSGSQQPVDVSVTGGIGPAAFVSGTTGTAVGVNPIAAGDYITISTAGGSVEISANPPVLSVNGRVGTVSLIRSDFTAAAEIHTHSVSQVSDFTTKANVVSVNGQTGVVSLSRSDFTAAAETHTHSVAQIADFTSNVGVLSVNGQTGVVSLSRSDFTAAAENHTHSVSQVSDFTTKANVVSVNGQTGAVSIVGGNNVTVSTTTSSIVVASADGIPLQSGQSDKVLSTDGTNSLWVSRFSIVDDTLAAGANVYLTRDAAAGTITISGNNAGGVSWSDVPAEGNATGSAGQIAYDQNFLYVAVDVNTWKRAPLYSWSISTIEITQQPTDQTAIAGAIEGSWADAESVGWSYASFGNAVVAMDYTYGNRIYVKNNGDWQEKWLFNPNNLTSTVNRPGIGVSNASVWVLLAIEYSSQSSGYTIWVSENNGDSWVEGTDNYGSDSAYTCAASNGTRMVAATWAANSQNTSTKGFEDARTGMRASDNGYNWSVVSMPSVSGAVIGRVYTDIKYANGIFLAVGQQCNLHNGVSYFLSPIFATSSNGLAWSVNDLPLAGFGDIKLMPVSVAYGNGKWVCIGSELDANTVFGTAPLPNFGGDEAFYWLDTSNVYVSSDNGITWQKQQNALPFSGDWCGIEFGNGQFVAVESNSGYYATSEDGITWSVRSHSQGASNYGRSQISRPVFDGTNFYISGSRNSGGNGIVITPPLSSGGTATFTVVASATSGSVAYGWQVSQDGGANWATVANAASSALVLTGLTSSDNGKLFRAVVSAAGTSSVYSNTALLTVTSATAFAITTQPADQSVTLTGGNTPLLVDDPATDDQMGMTTLTGLAGSQYRIDTERYVYTQSENYVPSGSALAKPWVRGNQAALWAQSQIAALIPINLRSESQAQTATWVSTYWELNGTDETHFHQVWVPPDWDGQVNTLSTNTGVFPTLDAGYAYGRSSLTGNPAFFSNSNHGGAVAIAESGWGGAVIMACRVTAEEQDYAGWSRFYGQITYNDEYLIGCERPFMRALIPEPGTPLSWSAPSVNEYGQPRYWYPLDIIHDWENDQFVCLAFETYSRTMYSLTSANGLLWTQTQMNLSGEFRPWSMAYGNGKYVAVGDYNIHALVAGGSNYPGNAHIAVSTDGRSWQLVQNALPAVARWKHIQRMGSSGSTGTFCIFDNNSMAAISVDGETWELVENVPSPHLYNPIDYTARGDMNYNVHYDQWVGRFNDGTGNDGTGLVHKFSPIGGKSWQVSNGGGDSGGSTTLSFSYTNGSNATIAIQWQTRVNSAGTFADVAGATSTTLSLSGLTSADSGRQYRARIQRTGGSDQPAGVTETYYTSTATLTVS